MADKELYTLEYVIKSSPPILYNFVSTPSGLAQWFADNVDINRDVYSFFWNGNEERANVVEAMENEFLRLQWESSGADEYFEFRIKKDEITGDTALIINDFAEPDEMDDSKALWDSQIQVLMQRIGGS